jgi:antitoxin component of MazEF toxin-antitoxin module
VDWVFLLDHTHFMQSLTKLLIAAALSLVFAIPAFALDQIKLVTDQAVTGQVVNETSDFVDIILPSGVAKRIPRAAIAEVQHDISTKDPNALPGPPVLFASATITVCKCSSPRSTCPDFISVRMSVFCFVRTRLMMWKPDRAVKISNWERV